MENNSKRELVEKFNRKAEFFKKEKLICEKEGKFILHQSEDDRKAALGPAQKPDYVDEIVYERDWQLFLRSLKMPEEEFAEITYCIDENKGAPIMFHGTSTFYLDMIKNNGFNKRNLSEELDLKGMLVELDQACIQSGILHESYWEAEAVDSTFSENCQYIQKKWNKNESVEEVNRILHTHIRHLKKDVQDYQYGSVYFTSCIDRACWYGIKKYTVNNETVVRGTLGEYFDFIMTVYILYRQIVGKTYLFRKTEYNDLMKKVYDEKNNCVAEWIQPVIIAVKDIPWEELKDECGEQAFFPSFKVRYLKMKEANPFRVHKQDYILAQASARYVGGDIATEKLDIVELKDFIKTKGGEVDFEQLYERFEIRPKDF